MFVVSLKKGRYKYQFSQFGWTHIVLVLVVVQSSLFIPNIYEGRIWFLLPCSLVIVNDIFAYIFGFFFGKKLVSVPLIKVTCWRRSMNVANLRKLVVSEENVGRLHRCLLQYDRVGLFCKQRSAFVYFVRSVSNERLLQFSLALSRFDAMRCPQSTITLVPFQPADCSALNDSPALSSLYTLSYFQMPKILNATIGGESDSTGHNIHSSACKYHTFRTILFKAMQ